jgi:hypothetical protein
LKSVIRERADQVAVFRLPTSLLRTVDSFCAGQDITRSQLFRRCIEQYFYNPETKLKPSNGDALSGVRDIHDLLALVGQIRAQVALESGQEDIERMVIKLIHRFEKLDCVLLTPAVRDRTIRLLNSLRCLRRDYLRGGMGIISNRLPLLITTFKPAPKGDRMDLQ